jgi:DNA-binding MarR family transcriptional regulator
MRMTKAQYQIMQAISALPSAYGASISLTTGYSIASIYDHAERLEALNLIGSRISPGGCERGHRHKLVWSLTPVGRAALQQEGRKP